MNNLDYFIHDIYENEIVEIEDTLNSDAILRIEEQILKNIQTSSKRKIKSKKHFLFALAATLLLALGITGFATVKNEWDVLLIDFMGINDADTLQLEDGQVNIDKLARYEKISPEIQNIDDFGLVETPIEITVDSSIGDKNSTYIRIETDYTLPETFNAETDYVLPFNSSVSISPMQSGYASTFTYFEENGKLGFLLSIEDCEKLNKSKISLKLQDLYLYHDLNTENAPEPELICAGTWLVDWKYNYKSNAKTFQVFQSFKSNGVTYYLTRIEISPISIRMEAFRLPKNRHQPHPEGWLEEIHFKDGTVLKIDGYNVGGLKDGIFAESYVNTQKFGNAIDSKNIKNIVIGGKIIKLY